MNEELILKAYQECGKTQVKLLNLEKRHKQIAAEIQIVRQELVEKKGKLRDIHEGMSQPLLANLDPKLV